MTHPLVPKATYSPPRVRVRLVEYDKPEMYCHGCQEWWPITREFWPHTSSFWRCRACERERARLADARRRLDPEGRIKNIMKSRRYHAYLRGEAPDLLPAHNALLREARAGRQRRRRVEKAA